MLRGDVGCKLIYSPSSNPDELTPIWTPLLSQDLKPRGQTSTWASEAAGLLVQLVPKSCVSARAPLPQCDTQHISSAPDCLWPWKILEYNFFRGFSLMRPEQARGSKSY